MKDIAVEYVIENNSGEELSKENCSYISNLLIGIINNLDCEISTIRIYAGKQISLDKDILRSIRSNYKTLFVFLSGAKGAFSKIQYFKDGPTRCRITHSATEFPDFDIKVKRRTIEDVIWSMYAPSSNAIIFDTVCKIPLSDLGYGLVELLEEQCKDLLKPVESKKQDNMDELKSYIQNALDATSKSIKSKIDSLKMSIEAEERELSKHYEELTKLEEEYKLDKDKKEKKAASLLNIFRDGVNLKGIVSIKPIFENDGAFNRLQIITDKIYINSMGYRFYVGRFDIELDFSSTRTTIMNLDPENRRKSYWGENCQHPHVSYSGAPCLGACASPLSEAMKGFRIKTICMLLLSYLSSINPTDAAGKYLTNWDIVDDDGNIVDFPVELTSCYSCHEHVTEANKENFAVCHDCGHNFCGNHHDKYQIEGEEDRVPLCIDCRRSYKACHKCGVLTKNTRLCSFCGNNYCCEHIKVFHVIEGDVDEKGRYNISERAVCCDCEEEFLKNVNKIVCEHCGEVFYSFGKVDKYICNHCMESSCSFCGKELHEKSIEIGGERLCKECFKSTGNCQCCQKRFAISELEEIRGGLFCHDCLKDAGLIQDAEE